MLVTTTTQRSSYCTLSSQTGTLGPWCQARLNSVLPGTLDGWLPSLGRISQVAPPNCISPHGPSPAWISLLPHHPPACGWDPHILGNQAWTYHCSRLQSSSPVLLTRPMWCECSHRFTALSATQSPRGGASGSCLTSYKNSWGPGVWHGPTPCCRTFHFSASVLDVLLWRTCLLLPLPQVSLGDPLAFPLLKLHLFCAHGFREGKKLWKSFLQLSPWPVSCSFGYAAVRADGFAHFGRHWTTPGNTHKE